MQVSLVPTDLSGRNIQGNDVVDCLNMAKAGQYVTAIEFKNQGTNSIAIIKFYGGEIRLASGSSGEGATWSPVIAMGTYTITVFKVFFEAQGAGAQTDNLSVVISKTVKV